MFKVHGSDRIISRIVESGTKLRKIVSLGEKKTRTDYFNSFHCENNELQFFQTPEDYVCRGVEEGPDYLKVNYGSKFENYNFQEVKFNRKTDEYN